MIIVKPTTIDPAEVIRQTLAAFDAAHPHRFTNCPACEGVGYYLQVDAVRDRPLDRVPCTFCDGSGLVLPEEAADWDGALR